jgi:SAM-dependent methyltransferase
MGHVLEALRNVCMQSPFTKHVTEWPRGYAGDFSVIDQICWQRNHAKPGTLAFWVEQYSLGCGIAQQHRNKVSRQAGEILACAREKAAQRNEARIAILASGSSPDLQLIQTELSELPVHFVLVDSDPEAIKTAQERLPAIKNKIEFVCGSVLTNIAGLGRRNRFDLVVAGGLFDYLDDRAATFLIKTVCIRALADDGRFFFTNIGPDNPFADWTQYITNWWLIHRSESDVDNLVSKAEVNSILLEYDRDLSGLTLLVTIKRKVDISRCNVKQ